MPCIAGSTAFAVVAIGTLTYAHYYHARQIIVTVMVLLWAVRLGGFLVLRVMATGGDSRFNEVKDKLCGCPRQAKVYATALFSVSIGQMLHAWLSRTLRSGAHCLLRSSSLAPSRSVKL